MSRNVPEAFYTVSDLADLLQVTRATIYRLIRSGDLEAIRVRRDYRISNHALAAYLYKSRGD